jgi:hypothetical protein
MHSSDPKQLRALHHHMSSIAAEGGGDLHIQVRTIEQVNSLLIRALHGDVDAAHGAAALRLLFEQYFTHGRPPCFTCGGKSWPPGGAVTVGALTLDPEHLMGGIICQPCMTLPAERLRVRLLKVLRKIGIEPGASGGRNIQPVGGRA